MSKEERGAWSNVVPIGDQGVRMGPVTPSQWDPSARELAQAYERRKVEENSELFEAMFDNMDDETFWEIIKLIEESGYSVEQNHDPEPPKEPRQGSAPAKGLE